MSGSMTKPKKSVALSGVVAGNTALCSVGQTGNDLHYRGYDILDLAEHAEYEEVAHLLIHGSLPDAAELAAYKAIIRQRALKGNSATGFRPLKRWLHDQDPPPRQCCRAAHEDRDHRGANL